MVPQRSTCRRWTNEVISLLDSSTRLDLARRAARLKPDSLPLWGQLTCPRMLAHVNDALRMGLGDIPVKHVHSPFRHPGVRELIIYWLPWGKGVPSSPELFRNGEIDWEEEQAILPVLMERFVKRDGAAPVPVHPFFGDISPRTWAVLGYRHTAHHLKQFGV